MAGTFPRRFAASVAALLCTPAGVVAIGFAGRADAAPAWSAPYAVLPSGTSLQFVSAPAVDAAGETFEAYSDNSELWLLRRPPGGVFGAPQPVAKTEGIGAPRLAVDAAGDVVIAWLAGYGTSPVNLDPFVATVSAAGTVSFSGLPLHDPGSHGQFSGDLGLAENSAGAAAVDWNTPGSPARVDVVTRPDAAQGFGSLTTIGGVGPGSKGPTSEPTLDPALSVDDLGNVVLAYIQGGAVLEMTGPSWPLVPTELQSAESLNPVVASGGDLTVVAWVDHAASPTSVEASLGLGSASGVFLGTFATISQGSAEVQPTPGPTAAIDAAGNAVVAWTDNPTGYVRAAYRPAGGSFGNELPISNGPLLAPGSTAAVAGGGVGLVAWEAQASGLVPYSVEARTISPSGALGPAAMVGEGAEGADFAFAPRADAWGEPVLGWLLLSGSNIEAAGYDTNGPELATPAIPATATLGVPVPFSVEAPFDIWSPPVSTSWTFGDGGGSSGPSVTHTYAVPGTYAVTVTATDALGNTASHSARITVVPAPGTSSPPPPQCRVPSLRHLSLASAKSRLIKAGCAIGKKTRARGPKHHRGLSFGVLSQGLPAGRTEPLHTKVNLTLGWFKVPKHRPAKRHKPRR